MSLKQATVVEIVEARADVQILRVKLDDSEDTAAQNGCPGVTVCAYNYLTLAPEVAPRQAVLVNTTGLDLKLGTGGVAFVVPGEALKNNPQYGYIVKLRYTPLQAAVNSVEEQDSPYHELLSSAHSILGMPVVCCELHSQMVLVAAAMRQEAPHATVVYIMNDAAALPLAFSKLVYQAREKGFVQSTITCGQAFGGTYEAITLHSALLAAKLVCKADVAIVAPGPGIVGSNTVFGHTGIAQGEALNAVAALGGSPIAPLRLSWADTRQRHQGLSHHSETVLKRVCMSRVLVPLPADLPADNMLSLTEQLNKSGIKDMHTVLTIEYPFAAIDMKGVNVTTMGRSREEDPAFFAAAFAAGVLAARDDVSY